MADETRALEAGLAEAREFLRLAKAGTATGALVSKAPAATPEESTAMALTGLLALACAAMEQVLKEAE